MTGFRARPHKDAYYSAIVEDRDVDPYAYFLDQEAKVRYAARLAERGLEPQGDPDRGHAWELSKYSLSGSWFTTTYASNSGGTRLENPVFGPYFDSHVGGIDVLRAAPAPVGDLGTFAQQAYSRVAPTSVVFDAGQFLGELREGLPHLVPSVLKSGAKVYKGLGSDYLNIEFGWKPFLNDLIKMGQALSGATSLLSHMGKRVHRRYGTPPNLNSQEFRRANTSVIGKVGMPGLRGTGNYGLPALPIGAHIGPDGSWYFLRSTERTRWFEGEFTSFMRLGFDPSNYFDRLAALVKPGITPQTLWELAPWSWLVDWHLRIGDTIKANELAANDLLIMHYGYAMEKTIIRDLFSVDLTNNDRVPGPYNSPHWIGLPMSASWVSETVTKRRLRANPYGFRVGGTEALNQGQLSILGALGLTRLK
jgi:hypothetical protein